MNIDTESIVELEILLDHTADNIVERGTRSESRTLTAMAVAASAGSPGAAAALIDWNGSEPARLRAFGIVHGVVLRELTPRMQLQLLAQIAGSTPLALSA